MLALALLGPIAAVQSATPASQVFLEGMQAYRDGNAERALPLLDHAASEGYFLAQYELARIYANPRSGYRNDAAAFKLFESIAEANREIDPYLDPRARFVSHAFVALARYWRTGIPELQMEPDPARARDYLELAASYFDNADAQFELARLSLADEADADAVSAGLHWLSTLAEKRDHVGAQAFLGDLFWNGRHVARRPALGLALVTIALGGAPAEDRIWIEELYQQVYCNAAPNVRSRATSIVDKWLETHKLSTGETGADGLATHEADVDAFTSFGQLTRTCADGEIITMPRSQSRGALPGDDSGAEAALGAPQARSDADVLAETSAPVKADDTSEGETMMGLGFSGALSGQ